MIKYQKQHENRLSIFKNIFINNDSITAYYIVTPYNYAVMDLKSCNRHIEKLYNAISSLHSSFGEIKMSMFKLKNIISREETIEQIVKTVRMYKKDYEDFPEEYKKFIKNISKDFTILAINIDAKNNIDIENQSVKEILKSSIDNFVSSNFSTKNAKIDEDAISKQNTRIKNTIQRFAVPANEKLVMNIYINSIFPCYNLVYNDYIMGNKESILAGIKQEIIPHLGWFEMSNSGIEILGGTPRKTYGAILTILEFPDGINSGNFNINVPGLHVNMNLLKKDKAILKFKRMRADILEEQEEVDQSGDRDSEIDTQADLIQAAIDDLRSGRIATEVDANILVIADSKEELDRKKKHIISVFSDINVVCSIAADQGKTFVSSFIKNRPMSYYHLMDLQYALSFQIDQGISVGDSDSKFASPVIGIGG